MLFIAKKKTKNIRTVAISNKKFTNPIKTLSAINALLKTQLSITSVIPKKR